MADIDAALAAHPPLPESARTVTVLAIDPGTTQSAWCVVGGGRVMEFGIWDNPALLVALRDPWSGDLHVMPPGVVVIEQVASYGMPVGAEVFETVYWSGRFAEAAHPLPVERITRLAVKSQLCHSGKASDANIRQALIDRYGGPSAVRKGGVLYGVHNDVWAALAVAVAWAELRT